MKGLFAQAAFLPQNSGRALGGPEDSGPAQTDAEIRALERSIAAGLDAGTYDADTVIDTVHHIGEEALKGMSPMLNARMMGVLSREYHAITKDSFRQVRKEERDFARRIRAAGQTLAVSTPIPFSIVKRFYQLETPFAEQMRDVLAKHGLNDPKLDLGKRLDKKRLNAIAQDVNGLLGSIYDHAFDTKTVLVDRPASKTMGQAGFDEQSQQLVIESNIAKMKKTGDLPQLVGTLGHENVHSVIASMWNRPGFDPEAYRLKQPDFYMLMRICDRTFYSEKEDVYRRHPEEILAERVGVRLGICTSRLMGKPRLKEEFAASATMYQTPVIGRELDFIFREKPDGGANENKTASERAQQETKAPTGVRALLSYLKKNF